ncbi:MAG: HPr(Ser) kinase/phosphatase, partial [Coprococcus comes]|nr:HPr(Ser) kinase/phosphatase [Coprococcus comes]
MYRVSKILNNNGVIAINTEDNQEYVLLGKGIGFGKKVSQRFEVTEDTATYRLTEQTDRGSAKSLVQEMDPEFLEKAVKNNIPVFITDKQTSSFSAELIRWMKVELAPCISIHGVLVDCYGVGVLIMGDSGIGKSEAALELIKRGHRLVTDDVVEIRKVSDDTLVGTAPNITRHFIELRGIGIIDVKTLFGVQSVRETQNIDLVITLEDWSKDREYDRLGLTEEYTEFLGNKVVCHSIPIRPGRNVAIIVESAAVNHRQKQMGYNAAQE